MMLGDLTTIGLGVGHPSPQKELDSPLWSRLCPAEGEGHEGFPPPPDKDLESPSSTR